MKPRMLWDCHPVRSMMARRGSVGAFEKGDDPLGFGNTIGAVRRWSVVMGCQVLNSSPNPAYCGVPIGESSYLFYAGSWFQISTNRVSGQSAASLRNSRSLENLMEPWLARCLPLRVKTLSSVIQLDGHLFFPDAIHPSVRRWSQAKFLLACFLTGSN